MRVQVKRNNVKIFIVLLAFLFLVIFVLSHIPPARKPQGRELPRDWLVYLKPNKTGHRFDPAQPFVGGADWNGTNGDIAPPGQACAEKRNFVFIKTMKCATETVVRILRRFGYERHLNFVLPREKNIYLGWPFIMRPEHYRQSRKPFNILVDHAVYNKNVMHALMPKDTAYLTIIREPYSNFKSSFHYFNVANISGITASDQVSEYLHNLDKYETFYKSRAGSKIRYCIPDGFSVTKNLLSHCLGMPLGFPASRANITLNAPAIQSYVEQLDRDFRLVMIMEYFPESLVLMKRLLCWTTRDILYRTENVGNYTYKSTKPHKDNLAIHQTWSSVDYFLYNHFNTSFWNKVRDQGPSFLEEVSLYNKIQGQISEFCGNIDGSSLEIPASKFHSAFSITPDFCLTLGVDLLTFLKMRFEDEEDWVESKVQSDLPKTC